MPNEINTGKKTNGQFVIDYQRNGYGGCTPIIDGKAEPSLMFGYVSENDKNACMKLLEDGLKATGGDIYATRQYIMNAVKVSANEIKPDEVVEVNGTEILISYATKKAYINADEVANINDIECELPDEAAKALLISRVETELERRRAEEQRCLEYDYYDEYDEDEE